MRKLLFTFTIFLSAGLTFLSCEKLNLPEENMISSRVSNKNWFRYDETICNNPWQVSWLTEPTDEQLASAVKSYLIALGINVQEIRISHDEIVSSCKDCDCLNGIHYFVRVISEVDKRKLTALNFYSVTLIPPATIANSN